MAKRLLGDVQKRGAIPLGLSIIRAQVEGRATDVELHQHSTSLTTVIRRVKNRKVDVIQSTIVKGDKSKMALPVVA